MDGVLYPQMQKNIVDFQDNATLMEKQLASHRYLQIEQERFEKAQVEPKGNNWDFAGLRIIQRQYSTHFFHHYTAKFIPQIPQNIIKQYAKPGGIIFDPFLGSGTTLVEARLQRHTSCGIEVNPLGEKIAKAKVTPIDFNLVRTLIGWLEKKQIEYEKIGEVQLFEDSQLWFRKDVAFKIKNIVEAIADFDEDTKNFVEIGLSDNLKGMSNALMHRTLPTLPKNSTYVDRKHYDRIVDNETRNIDVYGRVANQLQKMCFALDFLLLRDGRTPATPILGDSRNVIELLNEKGIEEVNVTVTSPPYWNAQNYQELHSLSIKLFKLKFPKFKEIGRDKESYLKDMDLIISKLAQIMKGTFAFVVGEDRGEEKYHEKLHEIICSRGFTPIKAIRREITNQVGFTKSIPHEYIYVFKI